MEAPEFQLKGIQKRETYQRMNYLCQASHLVFLFSPTLSRFYAETMKKTAKKLVLRMHPRVKKLICKSCNALLVPGVTSKTRIRGKREKHIVVTCLQCGKFRRQRKKHGPQKHKTLVDNSER
ncbi:ribonuclease P protein subunit p21-like [Oscarella lobularis]|uniref:ribonuclease P protein subunit p21-like n=1 Tax=Oscarella lobularis TaxID=121494 RepID=UPI003313824B